MLLFALACTKAPTQASDPPVGTPATDTGLPPVGDEVAVTVTLDGEPIEGAWVGVGGGERGTTDAQGRAVLALGSGEWVIASHPEARTLGVQVLASSVEVALERFSTTDNPDYVFQDPGVAGEIGNTGQCGHCHGSMVIDWTGSPHRDAASNPVVQDVFAGTSTYSDAVGCEAAGGTWRAGLEPGTRDPIDRCYLGSGALPDLNEDCGESTSCDGVAASTGGCADCHAPGIDGELGGRSLLEATGLAYSEGVHCDVCHRAENIDLTQPPGVAGALGLLRPSEDSPNPTFDWSPLTFGPWPDVPNPRMGAVPREHFRQAIFCASCHESQQDALVPGEVLDAERWPDGLPVHSTYSEWLAGPYAPQSPCQSCHMPPDRSVLNGADLRSPDRVLGLPSGWVRPPGSVRRHLWDGPRGDGPLLGLAAALDLDTFWEGDELVVTVTSRNVGAGHALPTGEPMRSVLLAVQARCDGEEMDPSGGDVVPAFGGALDVQDADGDWSLWPGAEVGERIEVVQRDGWRDYTGPGPFGDGTFAVDAKGLAHETWLGQATIVAVDGDAVTLDAALPAGDVAYRVDGEGLPQDGEHSRAWAGTPGFAFARVLVDADGAIQVPHHRAVDVVSDNRLLPQGSFTTSHRFSGPCADPVVTARLLHRPYPLGEARLRGWENVDQLLAEAIR